jgi:hypothetical protein
MKVVGKDYIDYWQTISANLQEQKKRFGIRLRQGRCWPLIQIGDEPASSFGSAQEIPVDLPSLPTYMLIVMAEDLISDPPSDLVEVLLGNKSFQQALKSPGNPETTRTAAA